MRSLLQRLAERVAGRVKVIQTLHWWLVNLGRITRPQDGSRINWSEVAQNWHRRPGADRLKSWHGKGGTGVAFDWAVASEVFASAPGGVRLILAGGLTSENVALAISELRPWGVDVSSGVEATPGRKDPARLAEFIANARKTKAP